MPCLTWGPLAVQVLAWDLASKQPDIDEFEQGGSFQWWLFCQKTLNILLLWWASWWAWEAGPSCACTSHAKSHSAFPLKYIRGTCFEQ